MHARNLLTILTTVWFTGTGTFAFDLLQARASTDTCADVGSPLRVPIAPGSEITIGVLRQCLCLSGIPNFLTSNSLAIAAVAIVGAAATTAAITDVINRSPTSRTCSYPDHATPLCRTGNVCFFTCGDGFTAFPAGDFPTSCVCAPPLVESNNQCVPGPCPSGICRRSAPLQRRNYKCAYGLTTCGVFGRSSRSWECIDTTRELESCGGCAVAYGDGAADGVDCTSIPGVEDVGCVAGRCVVSRCRYGFSLSDDESSCIERLTGPGR